MRISLFKNKKQLSDEEIVDRYKKNEDKDLVGILYERYAHLVLGLCIKYLKDEDEAWDAVSNIFEKLMIDLKKHNINHFKSWLYMVSKNHCLMILRQKSAAQKKEEAKKSFASLSLVPMEEKYEKEARINVLEEAIAQLKDEQKICIELFYIKEMSYRQIEDLTGFSGKQVKSFIQNGKRNLKILITEKNESAV